MSVSGQRICRLAEAAANAPDPEEALQTLTELRGELVEFERQQVARALTRGRSFGAVARAMGISRQAAHRRFSDLARRRAVRDHRLHATPEVRLAIEYARREGRASGASGIGAEHLLIAMLRTGDRRAAGALAASGFELEDARREATARTSSSPPPRRRFGGGNGELRALLAEAVRCAKRRGAQRVELEDLLRGALIQQSGGAGKMLESLGVAPERVIAALDETPAGAET